MENNQPISLHELLVPLLQGWDSVMVKADVEIGGTDQLFNFQVARRLQEAEGQKAEHCLMTPVINGTDGRKMSKSFGNTIWLNETPEEMFGQVMSIPDTVCEEWAGLLTDLTDLPEHPMERKKLLAWDIVRQLHGNEAADRGRAHFEQTVQRGEVATDIPDIVEADLLDLVVEVRGESRSKARRLIEGGGVQVDGEKTLEIDFHPPVGSVVKVGKREFVRVVSR